MILEILRLLILLLIAVPFIYIVVDVIVDISKRTLGFYQQKAKPILLRAYINYFTRPQ
jgi:ABC-type Fe3+ transport system permease subunit